MATRVRGGARVQTLTSDVTQTLYIVSNRPNDHSTLVEGLFSSSAPLIQLALELLRTQDGEDQEYEHHEDDCIGKTW